jgi:hypothetical protein
MRVIARWHRRLAALIMFWLAALTLSGTLVNHAHDWGLDRTPLPQALQRSLYGIGHSPATGCDVAFETVADCRDIFAILDLPNGRLLLAEHSLFLLDAAGRLLEKLPAGSTGLASLEAGHASGDAIYLRGGSKTIRTGPELLDFEVLDERESAALADAAWQRRGEQTGPISWERLLLDLHAARFLGPFAKAFNDLAAALILLLLLSGTWLYRLKRRARPG